MNLKIKKNALVASACMAFLLGGAPQVWAADFDSVTAAQQQTKKITGTILDQAGVPVIGECSGNTASASGRKCLK